MNKLLYAVNPKDGFIYLGANARGFLWAYQTYIFHANVIQEKSNCGTTTLVAFYADWNPKHLATRFGCTCTKCLDSVWIPRDVGQCEVHVIVPRGYTRGTIWTKLPREVIKEDLANTPTVVVSYCKKVFPANTARNNISGLEKDLVVSPVEVQYTFVGKEGHFFNVVGYPDAEVRAVPKIEDCVVCGTKEFYEMEGMNLADFEDPNMF